MVSSQQMREVLRYSDDIFSLLVSVLASRLCGTETLLEELRGQMAGENLSAPLLVLQTTSREKL